MPTDLQAPGDIGRRAALGGDDARHERIDVHHHYTAPEWVRWATENGMVDPDNLPPWTRWDEASALDLMDRTGTRTSVLTVAMLGRSKDPAVRKESARVSLDAAGALTARHAGRFAFFTPVFLDDPELSRWSVSHGMDELGAVGVSARTSAGDTFLGDPALDPLMAELDERGAVISTHPMQVATSGGPQGVPPFVCDFLMDTTHAALSLIMNGTLDRFPRLTFVLPHGGGYLPYIAGRIEVFGRQFAPAVDPGRVRDYLHRFYYDTAAPMSPSATPTLLAAAGVSRILYGSDWPPTPTRVVTEVTTPALDADPALGERERGRINRGNALRLLPALAPA
ncbi:amidohydrolase [Streptomyces sp. DSM 110735]|uniref:amidohydrolase family protein n=1 Tax=Streptomyces sp. DSM 110735 TaxID=2775031 RepID=UPI0018F392C3|nr:amidohydrolase family protein [Streptomyces sp. DSM 110735]MBJ7906158.1 amidohydrolase [Streptomyces sp. DSM 110735]